jgi:hypothetical protein
LNPFLAIFRSLRRESNYEAQLQMKSNAMSKAFTYPFWMSHARSVFRGASVVFLLTTYLLAHLIMIVFQAANDWYCRQYGEIISLPDFLITSDDSFAVIRDLTGILISSQVALVGILAIAVALVTFLGGQHSIRVLIRAYFQDSLIEPIAKSALALLAVLSIQILWPALSVARMFGIGEGAFTIFAIFTSVHILWAVSNFLATAYFISSSLDFAEPNARLRRVKFYYINDIHLYSLRQRILIAKYKLLGKLILDANARSEPNIYQWASTESDVLIRASSRKPRVLYDIWQAPLGLAFRMWFRRLPPAPKGSGDFLADPERCLYFPIEIGDTLHEQAPLVRGVDLPQFNFTERFLLRLSFRTRRC